MSFADSHGLAANDVRTLFERATEAKSRAYCTDRLLSHSASRSPPSFYPFLTPAIQGPYSNFRVGCAILLSDRTTILGANVENASYPIGTCAERVAMGTALTTHLCKKRDFRALGVASDMEGDSKCSPCGMCRQFLREFLQDETPVFMFDRSGGYEVKTMADVSTMRRRTSGYLLRLQRRVWRPRTTLHSLPLGG